MSRFDQAAWEERYRSSDAVWSGRPNPQLVDEAADLAPGSALEVGSGEGADALWLAARGWRVTGVDFSATPWLGRRHTPPTRAPTWPVGSAGCRPI